MNNRDDFNKKTRTALAARAGWHCSLPGCFASTSGPSEESADAVTIVGKAAHICGAAPGTGSRRYDPAMTSEQRKDISNGIWLCSVCADLIDRDEVTYSVPWLQEAKRTHEAGRAAANGRPSVSSDFELVAIGPNVVCLAEMVGVEEDEWTLRLGHFVIGDRESDLVSTIGGFASLPAHEKYVLSSRFGDGRLLRSAPRLAKTSGDWLLTCNVAPRSPRRAAQALGSRWAMHTETRDLYVDEGTGNWACVAGLESLPQHLEQVLSMQQGENPLAPNLGVRFHEYFEEFKGTPWLSMLIGIDVIRQAAIPSSSETPLQCVERVKGVEVVSDVDANNRFGVRLDIEVQGVGQWINVVDVYMPSAEQMKQQRRLVEQHRRALGSIGF